MNNDIYFGIPIMICIILAMYFVINWSATYSGITKTGIFTMIEEGMNGLSYIDKDNPDFSEDEAKRLNKFRSRVYLFMFLGIGLIIVKQIFG